MTIQTLPPDKSKSRKDFMAVQAETQAYGFGVTKEDALWNLIENRRFRNEVEARKRQEDKH